MKRFTMYMVMAISIAAALSAPATAKKMNPPSSSSVSAKHMKEMARAPHHMLAMAYKENMTTFANNLILPSGKSAIDTDLARASVVEIRRNFGMMKEHCQRQQMAMSADMKAKMSTMMQEMDTKIATVESHLEELEREVSYNSLNARQISAHAKKLIQECDRISKMHMPAKKHN